jgi:hypothetical protein
VTRCDSSPVSIGILNCVPSVSMRLPICVASSAFSTGAMTSLSVGSTSLFCVICRAQTLPRLANSGAMALYIRRSSGVISSTALTSATIRTTSDTVASWSIRAITDLTSSAEITALSKSHHGVFPALMRRSNFFASSAQSTERVAVSGCAGAMAPTGVLGSCGVASLGSSSIGAGVGGARNMSSTPS